MLYCKLLFLFELSEAWIFFLKPLDRFYYHSYLLGKCPSPYLSKYVYPRNPAS